MLWLLAMLQSVNMYNLVFCPSVILTLTGFFSPMTFHLPCHFGCNLPRVGTNRHTKSPDEKERVRVCLFSVDEH